MQTVRRSALALAALGGLLLAVIPGVQAATSVGRPTCLVSNERTGVGARSLQQAIGAAAAGDTLVVKGTCRGATVVDRDLTLRGVANKQFGVPTLDGSGFAGATLTAQGIGVLTIRNLTVTGGEDGGIEADSAVTLRISGSTIAGNDDFGISGLHFGGSATVVDSVVSGNDGPGIDGGGAWVLTRSAVVDNTGVGILGLSQTLVLGDSTIARNGGGGIVNGAGTVNITDSRVADNDDTGIHLLDAPLVVVRSTISGNEADVDGGGIDATANSNVTLMDSTVSGNTAAGNGGGIHSSGSYLVSYGSTIAGNTAGGNGGGAYFAGGVGFFAAITNSTVSGNTAESGGGIFVDPAAPMPVTLSGATVVDGNTPDDCVGLVGC